MCHDDPFIISEVTWHPHLKGFEFEKGRLEFLELLVVGNTANVAEYPVQVMYSRLPLRLELTEKFESGGGPVGTNRVLDRELQTAIRNVATHALNRKLIYNLT